MTDSSPALPATPADRAAGDLAAAGVADLFVRGRLMSVPRKPARRAQLLAYLAQTLFEPDREYTEQDVNAALRTVHDDTAAFRRYLVESRLLTRTRDGSGYRRAV